ncbi:MAG: ABC transporter permease [Deltaproteobacteria bacterium]|nr:ABC transporter permease [Deltaproteobacteria bacterium]
MIGPLFRGLLSGSIQAGTPLLYATLAELIGERAGIVNLGLEGVMLMGAAVGFVTTALSGDAALGLLAAALAGALFNTVFAFLVITRRANQLASGLALMFCGVGLSALLGAPYIGSRIEGLVEIRIPLLADLPFLGATFFNNDLLVYLACPMAALLWWTLFSTRWGLSLRAVGENPTAAFAAGKDPHRLQYQALFIAGLLGGIAGAHLSLVLAKSWAEWMTAGRGFIAVALVIFSKWHPLRAVLGAVLFGGAISLQLQMQARGVPISSFLLDMLPYLLSLGVLGVWGGARRHAAPASLGRVFQGTE